MAKQKSTFKHACMYILPFSALLANVSAILDTFLLSTAHFLETPVTQEFYVAMKHFAHPSDPPDVFRSTAGDHSGKVTYDDGVIIKLTLGTAPCQSP